jgi:putative FmdB family regulatory protein
MGSNASFHKFTFFILTGINKSARANRPCPQASFTGILYPARRMPMPTYDYVCQDCGHEFEAFQSMKDDPLTDCPSCQGKLKRLVGGGTGIIFKGSGFYINDSKKSADSPKAEAKKPDAKPAVPVSST